MNLFSTNEILAQQVYANDYGTLRSGKNTAGHITQDSHDKYWQHDQSSYRYANIYDNTLIHGSLSNKFFNNDTASHHKGARNRDSSMLSHNSNSMSPYKGGKRNKADSDNSYHN